MLGPPLSDDTENALYERGLTDGIWNYEVRGAHASRVLFLASRRERFGWIGRDAQTGTRDACAPRTLR